MAEILYGKPVAAALNARTSTRAHALQAKGIIPTLATLRVGDDCGNCSYEAGVTRACGQTGVAHRPVVLPGDCSEALLTQTLKALAGDGGVHGILVFSPLPRQLQYGTVRQLVPPCKDVDGITDGSMAAVYSGFGCGFTPCTAEAALTLLDYYGIDCKGKRACVVGRGLVTGRPIALLLLGRSATVTVCHTGTRNLKEELARAELVISTVGKPSLFGPEDLGQNQVLIDVGTSLHPTTGKIVGDFDFDAVSPRAAALTPVPGGVGAVTTALMLAHTVTAAEQATAE